MPTKKKKRYNARFPPARIKKIMQSDEEVGKVAAAVPVIISRALELFVETLLGNVNRAISDRGARTMTPSHLKMCIHSEPRFDFLKDLVAEVPELQGDTDEKEPQPFTDSLATASTSTATSNKNSTNSSRPHRVQRQLSTSRPRGRPRKGSTDSLKPKVHNRRFVEVESDDSESQIVESDEEISPLDGGRNTSIYPSQSFCSTSSLSLPSSPQVLGKGEKPLSFSLSTIESKSTFQRSMSYHPSSSNGGSEGVQPVTSFTITIPPLEPLQQPTSTTVTIRHNGGEKASSPSPASSSISNGLFSVSRLVDTEGKVVINTLSAEVAKAVTPFQTLESSHMDVDEDYDA